MSFYIYWQVLGGTKGPGTPDFEEQPPKTTGGNGAVKSYAQISLQTLAE